MEYFLCQDNYDNNYEEIISLSNTENLKLDSNNDGISVKDQLITNITEIPEVRKKML